MAHPAIPVLLAALGGVAGPSSTFTAIEATSRRVAITVDDLPGSPELGGGDVEEVTVAILRALAAHSAPVTGFVIGESVLVDGQEDQRRRLLDRWLAAGAELGNHTFSHRPLGQVPLEDYLADIARAEAQLPPRGVGSRFFRAPQNRVGPTVASKRGLARYLSEEGYRLAPFTVEHSDYLFDDAYRAALRDGDSGRAAEVRAAYLDYLDVAFDFFESLSLEMFGRDIAQVFLIHANPLNAASLDAMLSELEDRGYRFVTLEAALEDDAYETPDVYVGPAGISWLHRWSLSKGYGERQGASGRRLPETLFREPDPPGLVLSP